MSGLTRKQAADLIGVSEGTITGWLRSGQLRRSRPGRVQRFTLADLHEAQHLVHVGDVVPRWRADPLRTGQRLRALREHAGLNQQQLAVRCGITHERISRLEHGQWAAKASTILALSQALGCDPVDFVSSDPIGLRTYSTAEAGRYLGVPAKRVVAWLRAGVLPGTRVGGQWRVPAIAVAELDHSGRLRGASRRLDG